MARLNRRDFLKALGLGGSVSALSACGVDQNYYYTPVEQLLPYVVKNEVHTPGTPTFFATTVTTGPCAWPVTVRHREGRVVNVGANTRAPYAAVPTAALLTLQRHYAPDRFRAPRAREGATWSELEWGPALERLAGALRTARESGKKIAWLGPYRSGAIVSLITDFTAGQAVFWEPLGYEAEVTAFEVLFGRRALPDYNLSECRYVLSFGAPFLSTWHSARLQTTFATARDPNEGHFVARFAVVAPHKDQTGANADDWLAVTPGTEAQVARAIAKLCAAKSGYSGPAADLLGRVDIGTIAADAGVDPSALDAIATQMVEAAQGGGAVALPGGANAAGAAAVDLAVATYLLNIILKSPAFRGDRAYLGPIDRFSRLEQLVADMNAGDVGVLLIDDINPVYALPKAVGFDAAMAKVGTVVSLSSHPDETNAGAHLVLPASSTLEDWGDEEPHAGVHLLRQPGMTALHDTRSIGDVLLASARAAGLQPLPSPAPATAVEEAGGEDEATGEQTAPSTALGFEPATWRDYVTEKWRRELFPQDPDAGPDFDAWFYEKKIDGFLVLAGDATLGGGEAGPSAPRLVAGDYIWSTEGALQGEGDFHLVAYAHPILHDGRWANEPWGQETPEPMTGHTWGSFLLMNADRAKELGISRNDQVQVTTEHGTVVLGVEPYPAIRKDTVALAFGQGHTALGRYSAFGVNVVDLLGVVKGAGGALAWQQAKARVAKTGARDHFTSVLGHAELHGRQLALRVNAGTLAESGDAPTDHPGEMLGIHHLPRDPRLLAAGVEDFYETPDHPVHRWALTVDTNACNGCGVCAIACYAENNLPVIGKTLVGRGKEMNWLRINRYWGDEAGQPAATFVPMMCQQCTRAPCESVCPVLATYHNHEGLNAMIYNRCVGTRYCANNCPYQVRRFNFHSYRWPEPFNMQLNPDIVARTMGVMEKCTFCVQRTRAVKSAMKDMGHTGPVPDELLRQLPACADACPSQALTFGNLKDDASVPARTRKSGRTYIQLPEMRTEPGVNYLAKASFHFDPAHHGSSHADAGAGHGESAPAHETHSEPAPAGAGGH